jgi:hypothetical protein
VKKITHRVKANGEIIQNDSGLKDFIRDTVWRRREKDFSMYEPGLGFPADFDVMSTMPTRLHTIENVPAERYPAMNGDHYR